MLSFRRIFDLKNFAKVLLWMVPVTALAAYVWGLMGTENHRYAWDNYWLAWATWLALFVFSRFAILMQVEFDRYSKRRRYGNKCPTCGQKLPDEVKATAETIED